MMDENFIIRFSQEELLFLLRRQNLPDLPGMGDHPWGEITEDSATRIMETTGRSLLARGAISIFQDGISIDKPVHAILAACAYPEQMVILNSIISDQSYQVSFSRVTEFDVIHTLPYPWIHQFEVFPMHGSDMGLNQVEEWLEPVSYGQISPEIIIEQNKLKEIYTLVSTDSAAAQTLLVENGLPAEVSKRFTGALKNLNVKIFVQCVYQLEPVISQNVFTIVSDANSCWLIFNEQIDSAFVKIIEADRSRLDTTIQLAYKPFENTKVS